MKINQELREKIGFVKQSEVLLIFFNLETK